MLSTAVTFTLGSGAPRIVRARSRYFGYRKKKSSLASFTRPSNPLDSFVNASISSNRRASPSAVGRYSSLRIVPPPVRQAFIGHLANFAKQEVRVLSKDAVRI